MSNHGDYYSYIYIPVKCNKDIKKKCEFCFGLLYKLLEKQLSISTNDNDLPNSQNKKKEKESEIKKHIFYQLHKLNDDQIRFKQTPQNNSMDILHITIADSLKIKRHMIEPFIEKIRESLKTQKCFYLFFKNTVDLYKSQKNSKYFCAYSVKEEDQKIHLNSIMEKINSILANFGLCDIFSTNRTCHMSLAYTNTSLDALIQNNNLNINDNIWFDINKIINYNNDKAQNEVNDPNEFYIYVNSISIRVGNQIYEIPFNTIGGYSYELYTDGSYNNNSSSE
ncbi:U6 snRNA phosphodiesterase, putative [Plasmodium berghei]|uniref:U6 snRNA phosphodiesterase 1 n=2 Tax=Plasmodium berghei TaxID=5821 RepID=A0A509ARH3_PLABA|nr:U6 snRNA phosphodiesterase, putative [Plasmodium berghei ANKA]CXJ03682.1 U6 snRNA phosphodiesterase, putative [Plasmodium berghei]SCL98527.1 U6 snRNA phosphodiesterase, putative [Plasmodium berghei]SCM16847.1 U6 snRNA phosphodiesterase, putative [Plasmodium berghei]SCM18645.1 U6 snRNA phosphodiesterase, putative [Plasmodium berghei]SCN28080.1 U6 snRNA phosphodiesterase, putative [Plasmodium berghei]|eukprot:XP_034423730.1 U6 snRNA phosphodiesterase, putative [Plasmodium berghei ANKA]